MVEVVGSSGPEERQLHVSVCVDATCREGEPASLAARPALVHWLTWYNQLARGVYHSSVTGNVLQVRPHLPTHRERERERGREREREREGERERERERGQREGERRSGSQLPVQQTGPYTAPDDAILAVHVCLELAVRVDHRASLYQHSPPIRLQKFAKSPKIIW